MGKRATLKDIAAAAHVTTATVSYVFNRTPGQKIAPATRERILTIARDLNYVPSSAARSLRSKRSGTIGVVARKNLAVPRFSQTIRGIQSVLEQQDMSLLLCTNRLRRDGMTDYVGAFYEGRVDGVIFLGRDNIGPGKDSVDQIRRGKIPFVSYDCLEESDTYSTVDLDYRGSAQHVVAEVLERGPRRVLYLQPQTGTAQERQRLAGVTGALGAAPGVELIVADMPVTLQNLETWDLRYSVGTTEEGDALTERFLEAMRAACEPLEDGDAVVASWSGWTDPLQRIISKRLVTAELASNGESHFHPDFYMRLPNYEVGTVCARELLSLMEGNPPSSRIMRLTEVSRA